MATKKDVELYFTMEIAFSNFLKEDGFLWYRTRKECNTTEFDKLPGYFMAHSFSQSKVYTFCKAHKRFKFSVGKGLPLIFLYHSFPPFQVKWCVQLLITLSHCVTKLMMAVRY
jgi:hypothetical protein